MRRFSNGFVHGKIPAMKLRLLAHCLTLALFATATVLAAFVAPAKAGYTQMGTETMAAEMQADMPCCPSGQDQKKRDCTTDCPALSFCLTKCVSSHPLQVVSTIALPIPAVLGLAADDAARASRPFEPPTRPPRMNDIAGA